MIPEYKNVYDRLDRLDQEVSLSHKLFEIVMTSERFNLFEASLFC